MEDLYQNSGQQHVSSEGVHQNVSERRPGRTPAVPSVYDVRRCESRNLPEHDEAEQVPSKDDGHIASRIDASDSRFPFVLKIHGIDGIDHANGHENHQEYHGHTVGINQLECQSIGDPIGQRAVTVHHPERTEGTHRSGKRKVFPAFFRKRQNDDSKEDHHQTGMKIVPAHFLPPFLSRLSFFFLLRFAFRSICSSSSFSVVS